MQDDRGSVQNPARPDGRARMFVHLLPGQQPDDIETGQFKAGFQPCGAISYIINDQDSFQSELRTLSTTNQQLASHVSNLQNNWMCGLRSVPIEISEPGNYGMQSTHAG
jgi:hypothetical protein